MTRRASRARAATERILLVTQRALDDERFTFYATRDLQYQQNLTNRKIAIVVLGVGRWKLIRNRLAEIADTANITTSPLDVSGAPRRLRRLFDVWSPQEERSEMNLVYAAASGLALSRLQTEAWARTS